jgi:mgtE-like transporter
VAHAGSLSFSRTLRETFTAFAFDLAGIVAGFVIVAYQLQTGIFEKVPWVLALYPAVLGAKVVIEGLLSGRLSTALHLGTIYPRFSGNTKTFYILIQSVVTLTLVTSVATSAVSMVFGQLFWGITFADFPSILAVIVATMAMGLILVPATVKVAFFSFKRGLDPDVVVYPVMSAVATILITICYVLAITVFFSLGLAGVAAIILLGITNLVLVMYIFPKNWREVEFVKTIRESLASLMIVAVIVNVTGTFLHGIGRFANSRIEFFTIYPGLIGLVSDVGSVIGSTATTRLALGILKPTFSSLVQHAKIILAAWLASLFMFIVLAILGLLFHGKLTMSTLYSVVVTLVLANIVAVVLIVLFSFAISVLTFQKGLDPGNFVIPIESALASSITSFALYVALAFLTLFSVI